MLPVAGCARPGAVGKHLQPALCYTAQAPAQVGEPPESEVGPRPRCVLAPLAL